MRAALPLAAVLGVLAAACSPAEGRPPGGDGAPGLVVTQVPCGSAAAALERGAPGERYPAGSRVALLGPGGELVRVLSRGLVAAGAPALAFDARSVVFAGQRDEGGPWALYTVRLEAGAPRLLLELPGGDCCDPTPLPGGRVACVVHAADGGRRLVVAAPGGRAQPITFGPGAVADPATLPDGRLVVSMASELGADFALYTLNPDGTLLDALSDEHGSGIRQRRARATDDGGVLFLERDASGAPAVRRLDLRQPTAPAQACAPGLVAASVEPLPGGALLLAGRPADEPEAGLDLWRVTDGAPERLIASATWDEVEALSLRPRPEPRGRPSTVDPARTDALLVGYDAARTDGHHGPPSGAPRPRSLALETCDPEQGDASPVPLGEATVEEDGSFYLAVPADVPLRVSTLDEEGRAVARSDWFWLRPGEVRACFGCHEPRGTAPRNRPIAAIAREPEAPAAGREGAFE